MTSGFDWMIYGANGYTGALVAQSAVAAGMQPVLAGRNPAKVRELAEKLGLPWRAFDLEPAQIEKNLAGMKLVLHCAGPFIHTSSPMVKACLKVGAHYLDVTGEIGVFERVHRKDKEAKQANVVLLPGVGFDVVPSDCLAAMVAKKLPRATHLEIAFDPNGKASKGTMKTAIMAIPVGGIVRENGELVRKPLAHAIRQVPFSHRTAKVVSVPWGDVSTAYFSTKIPNITCYMARPPGFIRAMRLIRPVASLAGLPFIQRAIARRIEATVKGPTEEERASGKCYLWAKAYDTKESVEATMEAAEGYHFTVMSALECVRRVLDGAVGPGAWTPSLAFGPEFALEIPGTKFRYL